MPGDTGPLSIAERTALGTTARMAIWPPDRLGDAQAAVDTVLEALDHQASRFRRDSELSQIHRAEGGTFLVSPGLAEALDAALRAARWTDGFVDPTVGHALAALGYDRDFADLPSTVDAALGAHSPAPGWSVVQLSGRLLDLPRGVSLDLGATAKGLGSDRCARAAFAATGSTGGVLVSLGGDIAVAGRAPIDGWPVIVIEDPHQPDRSPGQIVRIREGGVATSSVACRRWRRGGRDLHHIVDARTGLPAEGPWRTATVAARTCVAANAASTAVIAGGAAAERWLRQVGLPARLVANDGTTHLLGSWPEGEQGMLEISPDAETGVDVQPAWSGS
ncbi:MAG TPA: FAD:protein FMN transferase [Acidimicrobiales bacterium]